MASSFTLTLDPMIANLHRLYSTAVERVAAVLRPVVEDAEDTAKAEHRWMNRTSDAEKGLEAGVITEVAEALVILYLKHGDAVFYARFLEEEHYMGERFAVVMPTLREKIEDVRAALRGVLR